MGGINLSKASPEQLLETKQLMNAEKTIDETVDKAGLDKSVSTEVNERGLTLRVETDGVLFDSGRAVLRPEASAHPGADRGLDGQAAQPDPGRGPHRQHARSTRRSSPRTGRSPECARPPSCRSSRTPACRRPACRPRASATPARSPSNATDAGRGQNRRVEILVMRLQGAPEQSPATALGG